MSSFFNEDTGKIDQPERTSYFETVPKLLSMVEANQVETIIFKDLSRFGRNYLEAGYYIELVFPSHRTRLIAKSRFSVRSEKMPDFIKNCW